MHEVQKWEHEKWTIRQPVARFSDETTSTLSSSISLWFKGSYFLSALTFYLMPSTLPHSYFPVGTEAAVVVRSGFIGFAVTIHQGTRGWRFSAALISHTLGVSKRLFFFSPPCDHVQNRFPSSQLSNLNRPRGIWFQTGASLSLSNPRYWCQWFSGSSSLWCSCQHSRCPISKVSDFYHGTTPLSVM